MIINLNNKGSNIQKNKLKSKYSGVISLLSGNCTTLFVLISSF